nr:zinc finger homeobox protein 4-like [Salvelinus alpinus]
MDSGEGGRGRDGGREGGEPDISTKPLSHPLLTPEVIPCKGSPSRTSAPAPAKEPSNLIQTEQGGAEGTAGREETPEGERGIYSQNNGVTLKEEQEKEEKLNEKKEKERLLLVDDREETGRKNLAPALSSKDRGEEEKEKKEEEEEEREEAISNQSQTKSKCSLLPRQSQHSSASSTVMASGTLNSNIHITPSNFPKHSTSPSTCPKLSLSPSNSPKHSTSPSTSPKRSSFSPFSPYPQNETEVRDTGEVQGNSPSFPLSFKPQQSALSKSTSPPAKDDGRADATHTSLIANGDTAKVPKPNNNPEVRDGDREMEIERDDDEGNGEKEIEGDENIETVSKYLHSSPSSSSSPSSPVSLNSHMALMHSRNSCKTLKCPKCNWHYKSQQTLQVHLREKHPESGGSCVCGGLGENCVCGGSRGVCLYCSTGKAHPRLSRGESYVCGYKPYRCDVCDYATSSKGNLSIHMQSDKHLSNVQAAGQTQHAHSTHSGGSTVRDTAGDQVYGHTHPEVTQPPENTPPYPSHTSSQGKRWRCEVCDYETSIARNLRIHTTSEKHTQNVLRLKHTHNVLQLQRSYYLAHCRSLPPQLTLLHSIGGQQSLDMHQLTAEEPVAPDSTLTPSPSPPPSSSPSPSPSPSPPPPLSLLPLLPLLPVSLSPLLHSTVVCVRCLVCFSFSSDSLESLGSHLSGPRSLPQSEWRCLVAGGCYCRRSLNKGEELAAIFSIRKCTSPEIDESSEGGERRDSLSPAKRSFSWLEETQSPLSPKNHRTDKHSTDQQTTAKCPLCQDTLVHTHLRRHLTLTHSVAQDCVDKLMSTVAVELPEILQKETLQRDSHSNDSNTNEYQTNDFNTIDFYAKESLRNESQSNDSHINEEEVIPAKDVPALPTRPCEDQHLAEDNTSHLPESPSSPPPPPTPPSPSLSHLPSSTLPPSPPSDAPPSSDRHGYRFRCGRCSLAFRTQEKLKLHWQYHAMRAATECHLCPRRCRSQEALQRHLLNTHLQDLHLQGTHPDQSGAHVQRQTSLEGEEEEGESMSEEETDKEEDDEEGEQGKGDEGEEDEKDDPDEEERPSPGVSNSDKGSGQQEEETGSEPSPLIKGSNPTLERFLDPARPYKCSFCCESFTQRTILLVHYNSVSHLHRAKARRALHDSSPSHADTPQGLEPSPYRCSLAPDPRPYRCRMCRVAYSQSSTLDIHLRSVLHQTRARGARTQLSLNPHTRQTLVPALVQTTSSSRSPGGGEVSTRGTTPTATRSAPSSPSPCSSLSEAQLSVGVSGKAEGHQAKRRRVEDLTASGGQQDLTLLQQQVAQAQMPQQQHKLAQAHIEEHTALLQPQLFSPTLLPHLPLLQQNLLKQHLPSAAEILQHGNLFPPLPLSPDSLFSLQQQLLLSFYLSGGLHLNPNTTLMNQTTSAVSPQTTSAVSSQITSAVSSQITSAVSPQTTSDQHPQIERLEPPSPQPEMNRIQFPGHAPKCETQAETADSDSPLHQTEKEYNPSSPPEGDGEKNGEMQESEKKERAEKALRVLLERYGWELALQSTQSRQRQQNREMEGCLEEEEKQCGECGKLFSDSLILKSHQEFVHRQMIPPVVLEMFSRQYRLQYDRLYPLRPFTPGDTETTVVAPLTPASAPALAPLPPAPASDSTLDQAQSLSVSQTSVPALIPAATLTAIDTDPAVPPPPAFVSVTLSPDQARASPTPSLPPPPPRQPQPLSEQDSTTTTTTPCPDPSQTIIHRPKLSIPPLPLPQLPLPRLPLSNLSSLPFPIDPSLLPLGLMQPIAFQSMLQYQSLLSSCHQPPLSLYTNTHSAPSLALPPYTTTHSAPTQALPLHYHPLCPSPALPPYTTTHSAPSPALPPYTTTHSAPSPALPPYTTTHCAPSSALPPYTTTHCAPSSALPPYTTTHCAPSPALPSLKRRLEEGTEVRPMSDVMAGDGEEGGEREGEGDEQRRERRQRTTISAEQLEVLYQRYSLNSNPTRSVLEGITRDTGLKKRVVQVWFQNTRARQRKGQLQTLGRGGLGVGLGDNHRRCPFCRALFKAQSALDAHVRARHWSQTDRPAYGLSHQIGSADVFSFSHNHGSYRDREVPPLSLQHSPSLSHHPSLPPSLHPSPNPFHPSPSPGVIPTERKYISGETDLTFDLNEPDMEEEEEEEGLSVKIFPSSDQAHEGNHSNLLSLGYKYGMASFNVHDCDQNSSPSLSESVDRHGPRQQQQQRQRTQMTPQQVAKLRACYREHPTPSPLQCEGLGRQLGLPRRVVQVWFQNGRAKEKRARSLRVDPTTG